MKIYTKKGDAGETGLLGGVRVPKDDLRIQVYGTFDELNAALGVVLTESEMKADLRSRLLRIQAELFQLGAELATPRGKSLAVKPLDDAQVIAMETEIDQMEAAMTPLKSFILPGGTRAAAHLHLARTICRRGERELVTLNRSESQRETLMKYYNRLSDYLFVCARYANSQAKVSDVPWIAP